MSDKKRSQGKVWGKSTAMVPMLGGEKILNRTKVSKDKKRLRQRRGGEKKGGLSGASLNRKTFESTNVGPGCGKKSIGARRWKEGEAGAVRKAIAPGGGHLIRWFGGAWPSKKTQKEIRNRVKGRGGDIPQKERQDPLKGTAVTAACQRKGNCPGEVQGEVPRFPEK